ncbi:hypothetical protein CRYUN_Cryun23aG0073200 [Craigia yunnanensis]
MEKGKKRRREEGEEDIDADHSLSLGTNIHASNKLVAIQTFILQSQLYSSVKDRTQVDRELESLRWEKAVHVFKLNTGQNDHSIMFLDDYLKQLEHVVKRMEERKQGDLEVFKWFKVHVIESMLEPSIEHQELCSLLSLGGRMKDEHISLLINAGLLTRQLIDPSMYWFAIPNIGLILKGLSQVNKLFFVNFPALTSGMLIFACCIPSLPSSLSLSVSTHQILFWSSKVRYKEMMLAPLEKKRLQSSPLDMRFHLRDLIGSGHLKTAHAPTGIVQVSKY